MFFAPIVVVAYLVLLFACNKKIRDANQRRCAMITNFVILCYAVFICFAALGLALDTNNPLALLVVGGVWLAGLVGVVWFSYVLCCQKNCCPER